MKNRLIIALALFILITPASGCAKKPSPDSKVLVKVSNSFITLKDFNARIAKLPDYYKNIIEKDTKRFLEDMITEKLFYEEALRRGLNRDREVADVINEAKKKIVIAKLVKNEVDDKTKVDEKEIREFYEANKEKFVTPGMWRASQILVPTEEEAKEILQELNSGGNFEEIARSRSKDATASRGGDVGFFRTGQVIPDFEKAALKLDVGQTSDVVYTKFGYHIIKLTDKKEPQIQPYDKSGPLIENELMKKKKAQVFYDFVMALKKKYGVTIDENAVASIVTTGKETPQGDKT